MSEGRHKLPFLIDTGALAIGYYAVLNIEYGLVKMFDSEEEAEAFVADANGTDVETVRRQTTERARMLAEYRENLIRGSREKAAQRQAENSGNEPNPQPGAQS